MKKKRNPKDDDLRAEYDPPLIRSGVQGKYIDRYKTAGNVVKLAPDVAVAFPDDKAVNDALRLLMQVARTSVAL